MKELFDTSYFHHNLEVDVRLKFRLQDRKEMFQSTNTQPEYGNVSNTMTTGLI